MACSKIKSKDIRLETACTLFELFKTWHSVLVMHLASSEPYVKPCGFSTRVILPRVHEQHVLQLRIAPPGTLETVVVVILCHGCIVFIVARMIVSRRGGVLVS